LKTTISIIVVFFIQSYAFTQTIDKLDEKYGFEILKFGTSPDYYLGKLKEDTTNLFKNQGISEYTYMDSDMGYVYNVKTKKVDLTFYKNQLMNIQIEFSETFSINDYNTVLSALQKLFGDGIDCAVNNPDLSKAMGRKWTGKKVDMEIHRLFYNKTSELSGYISIHEKALEQQRKTDDF
jgi:hypothetical protein